ncbi:Rho guanine nucleotide exchange factor 11 [Podarcis lilfordi]|uniref:Rho guanine nucleotide exchange factor 11 n=1 Tax=Podarcis lilfordi TaxID=74358 RepID=A0AA35NUX7_9SAUR|nr:Rho guanine nucleotide exchange factor 11 [Podarcis lilfordi]
MEVAASSLLRKMKDLQEKGPLIEEIRDLLLSQACSRPGPGRSFRRSSRGRLGSGVSSSPECHDHQLTDFLDCELQCLASYPLLLSKIIQHTNESTYEHQYLCLARDEVKEILENIQDRQAENHWQLQVYQQRLDDLSLCKSSQPLASSSCPAILLQLMYKKRQNAKLLFFNIFVHLFLNKLLNILTCNIWCDLSRQE